MLKRPHVIWLFDKLGICLPLHSSRRITSFRWLVFALTFVTYTSFHASRKPISVVKNVLNRNCSGLLPPAGVNASITPHWCDWKPFDGPDSNTLLGFLDSSYLFSYAVFMYFSGMLAERMDLRYFLSLTMLGSAVFTWAFGVAFYWQIHSLAYFISVQVACGIFQAGGWPGVVAVMGYWQGSSKRGLMFGLWNSHTSVGNILGTLMASAFVNYNWGLSFIVPGVFIAGVGVVNFVLLPPYPSLVGCTRLATIDGSVIEPTDGGPAAPWQQERCSLLGQSDEDDDGDAVDGVVDDAVVSEPVSAEDADSDAVVTFGQALRIPGVMSFSASLFFAKLVSYTFLYWLPRYLHSAAGYDASESANLSTLFDVGGIVGGIVAGMLSDWSHAPAIVCFLLLLVAIPAMFTFQMVSIYSHALNTVMLLLVGVLVNGPYALITTAVSADLGSSLKAKAMATVTAIIDGTGSVGAALGPLLAGAVSTGNRWSYVFYMLMLSNALSMLCLVGVMRREWVEFRRSRQAVQTGISGDTLDSDSA